jgi:hypothetical protein
MDQVVIHEQPGRHTYSAEHSRARVIGETVRPPVAELAMERTQRASVQQPVETDSIEIIKED